MAYDISSPTAKKVKDLDPDDQPREKAEKYGCSVLSVPDLWALILRTGLRGLPITQLCRNIMAENGNSLHTLERRSREQIRAIKGIGQTKSLQIEAVLELIRRFASEELPKNKPITAAKDIFYLLREDIGNLPHEEIFLLILNRRNVVTKKIRLTQGTATASLFDTKAAIKQAVINDAEGIILSHNHPSGNLRPSEPDKKITRELKEAASYMGIRLLDHVIVTSHAFFSFSEEGIL